MIKTFFKPPEGELIFSDKQLRKLFVPLIIEQLLAVTIGMAGIIMVAPSGEAAVSAIALVDAINVLVIQVFAALATGGAVVTSQYIGNDDFDNACNSAKQLFYTGLSISVILSIITLIFKAQILTLIFGNIDPVVISNCYTYFFFSAISYPFIAVYNIGAALFRSMNNSKISMLISIIMNIVNIIGNIILIYRFDMGVLGAGVSLLVSRATAAVIIFIIILKPTNLIYIKNPFNFKFDFALIKRILKIGVPNGLENGMFQIGRLVVQVVVTSFGTAAIAANAIVNTLSSFSTGVTGVAIGLGVVTVIGQSMGGKKTDQAVYYTKKLMIITYVTTNILNVLIFALAPHIIAIFNLSAEAASIAIYLIRLFCIISFFIWPLSFTIPNTLRASGDAKFTMIISMFSMWVFRIGLSYLFCKTLNFGIEGVWYAMYIDWMFRAVVFSIRIKGDKWKRFEVI